MHTGVYNTYQYITYSISFFRLVVFYVPSTARSFRDSAPNLLSLAKDVKLGFYTIPTEN